MRSCEKASGENVSESGQVRPIADRWNSLQSRLHLISPNPIFFANCLLFTPPSTRQIIMPKSSSKKASKPSAFDPLGPLPADAPYFYSLTLENIRCFADKQTLDLSDGNGNAARWTVILGENGTGKTTLLQALAMIEPEKNSLFGISQRQTISFYPKEMKLLSRFGVNDLMRASELKARKSTLPEEEEEEDFGGISSKILYAKEINAGCGFTFVHKRQTKLDAFVGSKEVGIKGNANWASDLRINGYGAKRNMGINTWEEYRTKDTTQSLFEPKSELINATEWLRNVKLAASMSPQPNKPSESFEKIESLLTSGLLPEVDAMRLAVVESGISGVEVTFHTPDGWVPLESLGLGYQTMIAWIVDFAARMVERYPDSPQPLHEPAIVLVDELDLHLHPRWQREIIGFLTNQFPKTQFIVTAHSPLVVQAAQDVNANIVLLRREDDHVVIDQNVRIDRNLTVDLLLTSDAFGLEALYSPKTEELMREQESLQGKSHLSAKEQERLKKIEQEIGIIPISSNPADSEAMALIREAAELLKVKANGAGSKTAQGTTSKKKRTANGTHS